MALARGAASLDTTLDVRTQRLCSGHCVSLVLLRLLGIAEYQRLTHPVDAAHLGGGQGMACALADHMPLVLVSGGEYMKRQTIRAWHIGNGEIEAP